MQEKRTKTNQVEFEATVRKNNTPIGNYGRIVAKELIEFIDKKVKVIVKLVEENKQQ